MTHIKECFDSFKSIFHDDIPKEFIPDFDEIGLSNDIVLSKDGEHSQKGDEASDHSLKDDVSKKGDKKLLWPHTCWICRTAITIRGTYIICSALCKRVYHKKCHNYMKVQFEHLCDKITANKDIGVKTTLNAIYDRLDSSKFDKLVDEITFNRQHTLTDIDSYNATDGANTAIEFMGDACHQNNSYHKSCNDEMYMKCYFCSISHIGCNNCRQFDDVKKMVKCSVAECTTFYCYPSCITKVRIIIPDKKIMEAHMNAFGHLMHLTDPDGKPIFICHSHTCWSCYDCDRYSYYWESYWRSELCKPKEELLINAWNSLKLSCKGKVESAYFSKGKKIVKPPRYPELKGFKCFYQSKYSTGMQNALTNGDYIYEISDDDQEEFQGGPSNILLRCIRCDRTWCTQCIHPDVHIFPNSGKQIICHDCIHLQVACTLTKYSKDPDNRGNIMKKECMMPTIKIDSSYPSEIYTQLKDFVTEHASYERKLSLGPTFISKPPMDDFDAEYHLINTHKGITNIKKQEKLQTKKNELKIKQNTKISSRQNHTVTPDSNIGCNMSNSVTKKRNHNLKSKEWNDIIKGCDSSVIADISDKFKYITTNVITPETRKLIYAPDTNTHCNCTAKCTSDCANVSKNVECTNKNCSLGDTNCGNRRFASFISPKLRLDVVEGKGIGAFATGDIEASELVCEYVGEVISQAEFQRSLNSWSFAEMDNNNKCHWYIMKIQKDVYIDSTHMGNVSRFINHSCDPNCSSIPMNVRGTYRMGVFAQKKINKGQEITYNYGFTSKGVGEGFKCYCNSKNCRGIIGVHPTNTTDSLTYLECVKNDGMEADVLKQIISDMSSINVTNLLQNLKQQPSPLDILNGMWTCGDLYRFEKLTSTMKISHEPNDTIAKTYSKNGELLNPLYRFLADCNHVSDVQFNYIKMWALNGLSIKEFDLANTKQLFSNIPWGIIALGHSEISQKMAMECNSTFDEFYTLAKKFIQNCTMAFTRHLSGMKASDNVQELFDLNWGALEACSACGGYGDSKCCDSCGDILHDNNNCGDFYVDKFGKSLCSFCQNSNHRNDWYISHFMERENIAMTLWSIRMNKVVQDQHRTLRHVCDGRDAVNEYTQSNHVGTESYSTLFLDEKRLMCNLDDFKLYKADPKLFCERQYNKQLQCSECVSNYKCYW